VFLGGQAVNECMGCFMQHLKPGGLEIPRCQVALQSSDAHALRALAPELNHLTESNGRLRGAHPLGLFGGSLEILQFHFQLFLGDWRSRKVSMTEML